MPQSLQSLRLKPCCFDALKQIQQKQETGKVLQALLTGSPFIILLGSNPADALFNISTTDWDMLAKAVRVVPGLVRSRCQDIATLEYMNHPGGPLKDFWEGMYEAYR